MSAITVTLRDDHLVQIQELARGSGETAEEWLRSRIESLLADPRADFVLAANQVLEKNIELYRRLA